MIEPIFKNLVLMVGPPGSGKSTTATNIVDTLGYTYINQDLQSKDHIRLFNEAIERGDNIVVDRMNFDKRQRARYLEPAKKAGYAIRITVHHVPKAVCMERCLKRLDHATIKNEKDASSALNMFFSKYERVTSDEADIVISLGHENPKDKPLALWVDLDNTLTDASHRQHHVQKPEGVKKDWVSFFKGMTEDPVVLPVLKLIQKYEETGYKIVYCSGRPDSYEKETREWLFKKGAPAPKNLFMRNRSDSRRDDIIKQNLLDFEVLTRFRVEFCLDDRDQVVKMLRERGLTVFQVADGDF